MIAEAFQWIADRIPDPTFQADGFTYNRKSGSMIVPAFAAGQQVLVNTLSGLVDYYQFVLCHDQENDHGAFGPAIVTVRSHTEVILTSSLEKHYRVREFFCHATWPQKPDFPFDEYLDMQEFITRAQTSFAKDEALDALLAFIGNVKADTNVITRDDGVTQEMTAKAGVANVKRVSLPNPVSLCPFRTFPEIDPVPELFVVRMHQQGDNAAKVGLFEMGDATWYATTIENIKAYLQGALASKSAIIIG